MDKQEIIHLIRKNYNFLNAEYRVSRIGIFGSGIKDEITEDSDLDLVVELEGPIGFKFNNLVEYLENLFGRKVDVLTRTGVENIRVKEVMNDIKKDITYV